MSSQTIFLLLLLLACPLLMVCMMRGGHGAHSAGDHSGHGCGHGGHNHASEGAEPSLDELRRRRDDLDREIEERESASEREAVGATKDQ